MLRVRDAEGQQDGVGGQERKSQACDMKRVRSGIEEENRRALVSKGLGQISFSRLLQPTTLQWQPVL